MSITAFPVLARILAERNLLRTDVGALAMTCAAVDDVTAWCLLAGVVLFVRAADVTTPLWATILGSAVYIGAMILLVRPRLRCIEAWYRARGDVNHDMLAVVFLLVFASAGITELLGIHALFGAFLVGAVMPKDQGLLRALTERLEDVTVVLLLPPFFAVTGLRTSISLVSGAEMWLACGLIMVAAIAGKLGGAMGACRVTGLPWPEAGAVGILMNTRGLMELVVLNIGLDLGVVSPTLFTMLVLMALVTTFMTTPLLDLCYLKRHRPRPAPAAAETLAMTARPMR